ncbi:MAG: hypothetical protein B6D44_16240 [Ignavibacteriales bacterium UTCHB2]|jgi:competence protein ComEC|nr:MAG: hypothetical protein B6D44_16240 [Ignavibacteriales bacterium UTCHB2]
MELLQKPTRFRAYQLGTEGSSFSYFNGSNFTLIEARITSTSVTSVFEEIEKCKISSINTLHITSWDNDHCKPSELEIIMKHLKPKLIEYPGYQPDTDDGKESKKIIENSQKLQVNNTHSQKIDPPYLRSLSNAGQFGYSNILYNPRDTFEKGNDNSVIQLFRSGSFTVASLGDVESTQIQKMLMESHIFCTEVDVMILAHHGADNGFTTDAFIKKIKPKVGIASSDYDDKYSHPKPVVKNILYENGIPLYTTKTGDVIIQSYGDHSKNYNVANLVKDSTQLSSSKNFTTKRYLASIISSLL